jgi:hypothetical protein
VEFLFVRSLGGSCVGVVGVGDERISLFGGELSTAYVHKDKVQLYLGPILPSHN